MDLRALQTDPAKFRQAVRIMTDAGPRPLAAVADGWQLDDFARLDDGWRGVAGQGAGGCRRAWLERPRGHAKTSDIAVMACWALFASKRAIRGVVAAGDRDQAAVLSQAVQSIVAANSWLAAVLDVQRDRVLNKHTGSELQILTSDAPTSYGLLVDFVVCDEVCHWGKRDLWDSLFSSAAKKANCLLLVISNAGFTESWQWGLRESVRIDPEWYFSRLDGPCASWITSDRLEEQRRLLPDIAYRRLWLNEWSAGAGDALRVDDIDAAIRLSGPTRERERGWCYVAGLDLGLSRDASALVVVATHVGYVDEQETPVELSDRDQRLVDAGLWDAPAPTVAEEYHEATGRLRLIDVWLWRPKRGQKVDIADIEQVVFGVSDHFGVTVGCDPWQAAYLIERLRKADVAIVPVDFTGSALKSMCACVLEAFSERRIELYPHEQLLADLRALRVVEKSYGVRLESPRGPQGHGDAATALGIALHVAKQTDRYMPVTVTGELVCYP